MHRAVYLKLMNLKAKKSKEIEEAKNVDRTELEHENDRIENINNQLFSYSIII